MSKMTEDLIKKIEKLEDIKLNIPSDNVLATAKYYQNVVLPSMNDLRAVSDNLETVVAKNYWPFPTYEDLLYRV